MTKEKQEPESAAAKSVVNKGAIIITALILLSLCWYLVSDRFTPHTDQARIQGYVVGVAPQVAGEVVDVWVRNNEAVEKGQRLFRIDPSQYQIALETATSNLESAVRQVEAGSAAVSAARANLRAAQANEVKAGQDNNRLEKLYRDDPGTISMRRLEASRATHDQARSAVSAAEAGIQQAIEQMGGDDDADNAILKTAQSAVEKAELDLANTVVTASNRGLITDLRADVGQFAGAGSPVVTLISLHDVWLSAEFTENNLGHMRVGDDAQILLDSVPGRVLDGKVRSIGYGVSSGSSQPAGALPSIENDRDWLRQSQRFPVVIEIEAQQRDKYFEQLRIGGQATVIVYSEGTGFLRLIGKIYIRVMSLLSYAY